MTTRTFSVKLDEKRWERLARQAEQTGLSKSEVARMALSNLNLKAEEEEEAEATPLPNGATPHLAPQIKICRTRVQRIHLGRGNPLRLPSLGSGFASNCPVLGQVRASLTST